MFCCRRAPLPWRSRASTSRGRSSPLGAGLRCSSASKQRPNSPLTTSQSSTVKVGQAGRMVGQVGQDGRMRCCWGRHWRQGRHLFRRALCVTCTVRDVYCAWRVLCVTCTVRDVYCARRLLCVTSTVCDVYCVWRLLCVTCTVCDVYCVWRLLCATCTVCDVYCVWRLLCVASTVCDVYCVWRALCVKCTVRDVHCAWRALCVTCVQMYWWGMIGGEEKLVLTTEVQWVTKDFSEIQCFLRCLKIMRYSVWKIIN